MAHEAFYAKPKLKTRLMLAAGEGMSGYVLRVRDRLTTQPTSSGIPSGRFIPRAPPAAGPSPACAALIAVPRMLASPRVTSSARRISGRYLGGRTRA